jgi:hypothetical protein
MTRDSYDRPGDGLDLRPRYVLPTIHPVAEHSINPVTFYGAYRRSELRSCKSEPDVIGNPYAGLIHELGFQNGPHILKIFAAILARQASKKAQPKGFNKARNVSRQGSWEWNQGDAINSKASPLKARCVVAWGREVPRNSCFPVYPPLVERSHQRAADFVDASESSTLSNEASAWPQRTMDSCNGLVGPFDPMQHGIAKDSVEFFAIRQCHSVDNMSIQAELARRFDERDTRIDRNNLAANIRDLLSENAVATPEVEYAFTGLRSQKLQQRRS